MTAREHDPLHLDIAAFARGAGHLEGRWPLQALTRLMQSALAEALPAEGTEVAWSAQGELRPGRAGEAPPTKIWLHLSASTHLPLECQRCLGPVVTSLVVERRIQFVHGEDAAAELDAESDDDVLALTRSLDLQTLIEDELLLAVPLVPRHDACPTPLEPPAPDKDALDDAPNPFAALAALKRSGRIN